MTKLGAWISIIIAFLIRFWRVGCSFEEVRNIKHALGVFLFLVLAVGLTLLTFGIGSLFGLRLKYSPLPHSSIYVKQSEALVIVVGLCYLAESVVGFLGIHENIPLYTKALMVLSVNFGIGSITIFIVWICAKELLFPEESASGIEASHTFHMELICGSSIFQIITGYLSYLVCVHYAYSRGYYNVNEEEAWVQDFYASLERVWIEESQKKRLKRSRKMSRQSLLRICRSRHSSAKISGHRSTIK